jgi:hypothetical protein
MAKIAAKKPKNRETKTIPPSNKAKHQWPPQKRAIPDPSSHEIQKQERRTEQLATNHQP